MKQSEATTDWALYKRLLGFVFQQKAMYAIAMLGFCIYASTAPMLAHLMDLIEQTYQTPTIEARSLLVVMVLSIFAFRGLGSFLGDFFLAKVGRTVVHKLRTALFNHYLILPNDFFDKHAKGHIISKITFDVEQVYGSITNAVTSLVREGLTVIFLLSYMFYMNWKLTLIFFAAAPFLALIVKQANKYFKKYSINVQGSMGKVTQIAGEAVNAYQEVKIFSGHEYEKNRFAGASDVNRKQTIKFYRVKAISVPVMQMIVAMSIGALIWVALDPRVIGGMDFGELMAFMTAASTLAKPMRTLAGINAMIQQGIVAAKSIFDVLGSPVEDDLGEIDITRSNGDVTIKDLSFSYPDSDEMVLKNIQLEVKPGESVALVGKSGSGKSTLINLLTRFYDYETGDIFLDGTSIKNYPLDDLRRQIALVSQGVTLFNDTIFNNIAYGCLAEKTKEEVYIAAKAAHALEFIEQLPQGMDTIIGDDGVMLSGGQRQRLAIARAILKDAPILILDEATSALDTESERYIQDALDNLMKNRTSFVVAHRLSTIENADTILVVNNGEIVERGNHNSLISKGGFYKNLYDMQFSG
ncbi:lipid A export permease/ATP-binding protein MsbA [Oceaniserpentilla sp. 4NH20-0058]|uniref:lipid A export permease/ATP-binding protein MsbA n=1 Tax=Oceaniserpentilla sp. 4NH20-0058 TaxID=3127660 RepID=UPI00310AFB1E